MTFNPRSFLFAAAALLVLPFAGSAQAFEPQNTECLAPAAPGGGWDFTCRQVGKALQDLKLIPGTMQVTNLTGGSGAVAFAEVVNKRNTDNNVLIAASSSTSTRLAQGAFPGGNMDQVRWLGTIGAEYFMPSDGGIASLMIGAQQLFRMDQVMAAMLLIGLVGALLGTLGQRLESRATRWRTA